MRQHAATLTVKGKFVASVLSGTLHSHWLLTKGCDGTTAYSASAATKSSLSNTSVIGTHRP